MGGAGAGHKSERARRSRLVNIQKARAARRRAPLPWRSGVESRIIEQLVWQWWVERNSGQWLVASGEKSKQQVPKGSGPSTPLRVNEWLVGSGQRQDRGKAASSSGYARHGGQAGVREADRRTPYRDRPWAKYRVARLLGVSHTWVNKLVKRIEADPERMRRKMRAFVPATFEKLERAREETRRERERGWLRGPIRWRRVKVTLEGRKRKVVAATQEEMKRRGALRQASFGSAQDRQGQPYGLSDGQARLRQGYGEASGQAFREGRVETQRDSASRAGAASSAPTKASAAAVRYAELPTWARGFPLPGDAGTAVLPSSGQAGRPRPVPFAFRRRR